MCWYCRRSGLGFLLNKRQCLACCDVRRVSDMIWPRDAMRWEWMDEVIGETSSFGAVSVVNINWVFMFCVIAFTCRSFRFFHVFPCCCRWWLFLGSKCCWPTSFLGQLMCRGDLAMTWRSVLKTQRLPWVHFYLYPLYDRLLCTDPQRQRSASIWCG